MYLSCISPRSRKYWIAILYITPIALSGYFMRVSSQTRKERNIRIPEHSCMCFSLISEYLSQIMKQTSGTYSFRVQLPVCKCKEIYNTWHIREIKMSVFTKTRQVTAKSNARIDRHHWSKMLHHFTIFQRPCSEWSPLCCPLFLLVVSQPSSCSSSFPSIWSLCAIPLKGLGKKPVTFIQMVYLNGRKQKVCTTTRPSCTVLRSTSSKAFKCLFPIGKKESGN